MIGADRSVKAVVRVGEVTPYVKAVRRCYLAAFDATNLKIAVPKVHKVLDQFITIIEAQRQLGPLNLQKLCVEMSLDVIGRIALETDLGGLNGSTDIHKLLIEVGYIIREQAVHPFKTLYCKLFPRSSLAQRRNETIGRLTAEWDRLTEDVLKKDDPPEGEMPLWHVLRTLVDPETGERIKRKGLRTELATAVVAGTDTTGHQLAWILALLASHPHITENIVEQLKEKGLFGPDAREVVFEDLADLTYVTAVVREGMRVAPVATGSTFRAAKQDMKVLGYRIPKGTMMALASNRWAHLEDHWKDPQAFKPERWLMGEDMSQKHYLGFSYGPRDCVGQRLAMMELRVAIIRLVQRYTFSLTVPLDDLMMKARSGLVVEAMDGIWMDMHPRTG